MAFEFPTLQQIEADVDAIMNLTFSDLRVRLIDLLHEVAVLKSRKINTDTDNNHLLFHIDPDPAQPIVQQNDIIDNSGSLNKECGDIEIKHTFNEKDILSQSNNANTKEEKQNKSMLLLVRCFNCDGDHTLNECSFPRDPKRIARSRRDWASENQIGSVRYHVDGNQRFSHFKPGLPASKALRRALGLNDNQLPPYIYRLRQLGYPPGWLKHARVLQSGIQIFVHQDSAQKFAAQQTQNNSEKESFMYDESQVYEWPGFNVPEDDFYKNETSVYKTPPRSKSMLAEKMRKWMRKTVLCRPTTKIETYIDVEEVKTSPEIEVDGDDNYCPATPSNIEMSSSTQKEVVENGTPVMATFSRYAHLPPQESWAKDSTDHILFENLPESTGKWDALSSLLKHTRSKRKQSQIESDCIAAVDESMTNSPPKIIKL